MENLYIIKTITSKLLAAKVRQFTGYLYYA